MNFYKKIHFIRILILKIKCVFIGLLLRFGYKFIIIKDQQSRFDSFFIWFNFIIGLKFLNFCSAINFCPVEFPVAVVLYFRIIIFTPDLKIEEIESFLVILLDSYLDHCLKIESSKSDLVRSFFGICHQTHPDF